MTLDATHVLAAVPVSDPARAGEFYARFFGREADGHPMPTLAQWQVGDGVFQVVVDPDRAGGGLVTLQVPDLEAAAAGLAQRGVDVDVAEGTVVAAVTQVTDPDGNAITVVETG